MAQPTEFATYQLYQTYHKQVHASDEGATYLHFGAVNRTSPLSQSELLTGYMQQMIGSLLEDMNTRGDCWLLRAIAAHELPAIHVLDYSAVAYVYTAVFCPEEAPVPDTRTIPYTSRFTRAPGGMRYTDHNARTCTLDLRATDELQPLCQALLMHARNRAMQAQLDTLVRERNALGSTINELRDRIFGLEHALAAAQAAQNAGE